MATERQETQNFQPHTGVDEQTLKEAGACALYNAEKISLPQAMQIMGVTRREFEEKFNSYGFCMMPSDPETLQIERNQMHK